MGIKGISSSERRKFKGLGGRRDNPLTIKSRRKEAAERLASWQALSPAEQLKVLDARLGKGKGAQKQREKLAAKLRKDALKVEVVTKDIPTKSVVSKAKGGVK